MSSTGDLSRALVVAGALGALITVPMTLASPGGLDGRGGHHCRKSVSYCSSHGLRLNEYHCHRRPCSRADIQRHRGHGH